MALLCNSSGPADLLLSPVAFRTGDDDPPALDTTSLKQTRDPLYTSMEAITVAIDISTFIILYFYTLDFLYTLWSDLFVLEDRFCTIQREIKLLGCRNFEASGWANLNKESR